MYWPDYRPRTKKTSRWRGLGILLVVSFSVFIAGALNGWWQIFSPSNTKVDSTADVTGLTVPVASTLETAEPAVPTRTPLPSIAIAFSAPPFTLPDLFDDTQEVSLSDYAGQPVILNFWASWCVPCRTEMPALQRAFEQHRENGLIVLGVNQLFMDDLGAARAFVKELSLTFPSVRDDTGYTSNSLYRVVGLPTSVFVTAEGKIAYVQIGQLTDEQIEVYSQRLVTGNDRIP